MNIWEVLELQFQGMAFFIQMVLKPKEAKVKVLEGQGDAPMLVPRGHRYAVGQAGRSDLQGVVTPYVKRL